MPSKKLLWLLPLLLLAACANSEMNNETTAADSVTVSGEHAVTALPARRSAGASYDTAARKIIRTADIRCVVPDVISAVTKVESMVTAMGGIIQESNVTNEDNNITTKDYKRDSLLQTQTYTTTAQLTVRVPAQHLDTVLNTLPALASFIERRSLRQNDVTLQYMANALKGDATDHRAAGTVVTNSQNSNDQAALMQYKDNRRDQQVDRKIENLKLLYDAGYATVTIAISQPTKVIVTAISDPNNIAYVPFYLRFAGAFSEGWQGVQELLIALVNIWPLWLLLAMGWTIYRKARRRGAAVKA
ncbi:MAG: DUF4349 domain-containing protein [Bacteroidota bacterium]